MGKKNLGAPLLEMKKLEAFFLHMIFIRLFAGGNITED
jgi:hypothetical protein